MHGGGKERVVLQSQLKMIRRHVGAFIPVETGAAANVVENILPAALPAGVVPGPPEDIVDLPEPVPVPDVDAQGAVIRQGLQTCGSLRSFCPKASRAS